MVEKVLVGKKNMHKGALMGVVSNGGQFQVGDYVIELVALNKDFSIVQVYRQGLDATPVKQGWTKTKKVIEKQIVEKVVAPPKKETPKLVTDYSEEVMEL